MSSREIAELTGKRHDHVMRDIRDMLSQLHGEEALPKFGGSYVGQDNTSRPCFHLPKRETLILVSGYSVELRARIIDRWQELEGQAANGGFAVPQSLPEALRLAADLADKMQEQARAIETMRPKVEAHDKIAESFGSVCRRIAAKNLGIQPKVLNRWMMTNGWTYLHGNGDTVAYQAKIAAGYLEHKVDTGERADGTIWSKTRVMVTPKGMLALAKAFPPAAALVA